jgi:hypothetical protein
MALLFRKYTTFSVKRNLQLRFLALPNFKFDGVPSGIANAAQRQQQHAAEQGKSRFQRTDRSHLPQITT